MRRRGSNLFSVSRALDSALDQGQLREGLLPHQARLAWGEVVGERIAAASNAERVRGGVLFVSVRSSAWANELTFFKTEILGKINARVGSPVLSDIHFTVAARSAGRGPQTKPTESESGSGESGVLPLEPEPDAEGQPAADQPDAPAPGDRIRAIAERAARAYDAKRALGWIECRRCGAFFDPSAPSAHGAGHGGGEPDVCPLCQTLSRAGQ